MIFLKRKSLLGDIVVKKKYKKLPRKATGIGMYGQVINIAESL